MYAPAGPTTSSRPGALCSLACVLHALSLFCAHTCCGWRKRRWPKRCMGAEWVRSSLTSFAHENARENQAETFLKPNRCHVSACLRLPGSASGKRKKTHPPIWNRNWIVVKQHSSQKGPTGESDPPGAWAVPAAKLRRHPARTEEQPVTHPGVCEGGQLEPLTGAGVLAPFVRTRPRGNSTINFVT